LTCVNAFVELPDHIAPESAFSRGAGAMAVKAKRTKRARKPAAKTRARQARKSAGRKAAKKSAKKAAGKTIKKAVAKKPSAPKRAKKAARGGAPANRGAKKAVAGPVAKASAEKTSWRISPEVSQSILKIDTWTKGDLKIEYLKVYRTGWVVVDQRPDLEEYNPDEGINIFEEFEFDEHQLYDGSEQASIVPNGLPAEERQRLLSLSEAQLEAEGWVLETVTRFKGPLVVEPV
jgi:hypothetical protein